MKRILIFCFILMGCDPEGTISKTALSLPPGSNVIVLENGLNVPWLGPAFAQTENGLFMTYQVSEGIQVSKSLDGGITMNKISTVPYTPRKAYLTALSNNDLLMVVYNDWPPTEIGFIRSSDGIAWSPMTPISITPGDFSFGPIIEHFSSWSFSHYTQTSNVAQASIAFSFDKGFNWESSPIQTPPDGNAGLTEVGVIEVNCDFIAAIRADEGIGASNDGFYLSISDDMTWPITDTIGNDTIYGDKGRIPIMKRLEDGRILLSYRLFDSDGPLNQKAAFRIIDQFEVGERHIIASGVNNAPFIYKHGEAWFALYQLIDKKIIIRTLITVPTPNRPG